MRFLIGLLLLTAAITQALSPFPARTTPVVETSFAHGLLGVETPSTLSKGSPVYVTVKGVAAALKRQSREGVITREQETTKLLKLNQNPFQNPGNTVEDLKLKSAFPDRLPVVRSPYLADEDFVIPVEA